MQVKIALLQELKWTSFVLSNNTSGKQVVTSISVLAPVDRHQIYGITLANPLEHL